MVSPASPPLAFDVLISDRPLLQIKGVLPNASVKATAPDSEENAEKHSYLLNIVGLDDYAALLPHIPPINHAHLTLVIIDQYLIWLVMSESAGGNAFNVKSAMGVGRHARE